ncbi:hypothetical protein EV196_103198 [Mariniflexile fucanivorans]|uniref:DUF4129 domain-containing protein n=1 Tax=Mariniflexile fucanivorans TaxID=264023 RepID=A0A4R1RKQ2_9FLAO|nr:DUF4129 domain-containing protein [Mariniflexile fucanivorans]TCL66781.1 hypothetical protein EV196_103198 [Mariniflexile fucanivorans]
MTKFKYHNTFLSVSFLMSYGYAFAQDSIQKDSSKIQVTYFKKAIKQRYNGDDFNYNINDTGGINLLQRILQKFFGWLGDIFGFDIDFINYQTLEYIVYGFMGVACLYLVIKFLMQSPVNSVFKTETKDIDTFKYVEENIKDVNFDTLISDALKENNFRLATRYLYLKSLKLLTNKNSIEWHYDKTNSDYINEIKDENTKSAFKRISYIYDYVWYGEFPIDEAIYTKNKYDFDKLNTLQHG